MNTQQIITELTERLHERTQGFLRTERKLRKALNMLRAILTEGVYSEVILGTTIIFTLLDGRPVGIWGPDGWDPELPYRGPVKVKHDKNLQS